jgi:tRNA pseudouridine32 synthase/23S rRNA pseudouridine746 synthase
VHAAHAAGLNTPIVGDELYGSPDKRLMLHAEYLKFTHPVTGEVVEFTAAADFQ